MVRGPAAVLTAYAGAFLYFELAPSLPDLGDGELTTVVCGAVGMALLALAALLLLPARDSVALQALLVAGGGLLAGALQVASGGPAANVPKLLFAAALGMLLARLLDTPPVVVAVPLFLAGVEVAGALAQPGSPLVHQDGQMVDFVTFSLPHWGTTQAGQLALSDMVFLAFYASAARRYGFRPRATPAGLGLALAATLLVGVAAGRSLPLLPGLAVGLLVPNLDRVAPLLRRGESAVASR